MTQELVQTIINMYISLNFIAVASVTNFLHA